MKSTRSRKTNLVSIASVLRESQKKTQHVFATSGLRQQWPLIVGEMLASQTRPKKIDRNILWVSVENGALNYELSLMKATILEKIFEISQKKFKEIKFVHESLGKKQSPSNEPSRQKFVRAELKEDETLDSILENIKTLRKKITD